MDTWSSCIALDGIESTLAGTASRFSSETIAACSSRSATVRACSTVSRAAPCTCGAHRSE